MIEISEKSKCSGCHACYNICPQKAIKMQADKNGFLFPEVDKLKCVNCDLCTKVCPIISARKIENEPKVYVCYNKNEKIRKISSSGGIFSLIANEILSRDGIVFGAAFDEKFSVSHIYIDNIKDLDTLRRSKYVQSSINDTYYKTKKFLDEGRFVLFTGTPCQIEGLLSYLGKEYDRLYTQDIVCHGVPSPKVWEKYLRYRYSKDKKKVLKINFRDKSQDGWHRFSLSFKYNDSEYAKNQRDDLYMKAFLKNICLRDSCYECSFRKKNRLSDITLADCWGIKNIKEDMDDDKGVSLVLVNSQKGNELYNCILSSIDSIETTMDKAIESNSSIIKSPEKNKNRILFFNDLDNMEFDKLTTKYIQNETIIKKCIKKIKKMFKR